MPCAIATVRLTKAPVRAVDGGRKRGRALSQTGSGSPGPSQPRSQGRADLLQDVARGLRGRSKDVLALLGMLSVDFVSPQHVQAFLVSLKDQCGAQRHTTAAQCVMRAIVQPCAVS